MATPASNNTATATPATSTTATPATPSTADLVPGAATLQQAAKFAIEEDRAIMLDYYRQTANGTAYLGEDPETKERILIKSKDEFTSLIKKLYKVGNDYIILTENSLYIVSGKIQKRRVNVSSLQEAYESSL